MFEIYNKYPDGTIIRIECEIFKFPGGEVHFKLGKVPDGLQSLLIRMDNPDDIMLLVLFADAFRHKDLYLELLYTPYARQDRRTSHEEPFSLRAFAKLINMCGFKKVTVYDPHSDVTPALIDNIYVVKRVKWTQYILSNLAKKNDIIIVSPDAGAMKTNQEIAQLLKVPHIVATKVRSTETGEITETQVHTNIDLKDKYLVVVDDICDGGRTFIELAKVLKKSNPGMLHLFVTVGIFSKGIEVLQPYYDAIDTNHTIRR